MRYFFRIEYDGTAYGGWQRQPGVSSVQQTIEDALSTVLRTTCTITGAGRTDAGVHARRQAAHVDSDVPLDPVSVLRSVNGILPSDIGVYDMSCVDDDFHARYTAVKRRYCYFLTTRKTPLLRRRAWHVAYEIDWQRVARDMTVLRGRHDFTAFCAAGSGSSSAVCTVEEIELFRQDGQWVFSIAANRFVYKMVRSIVGTLIDIGRGKIHEPLSAILCDGRREKAGTTAPACGLVLEDVVYPGAER